MPLTRTERQLIEDIVKQLGKATEKIKNLEDDVQSLQTIVSTLDDAVDDGQLTDAINEAVKDYISKNDIKKHDHTSDAKGGDAFAKLGANLIGN